MMEFKDLLKKCDSPIERVLFQAIYESLSESCYIGVQEPVLGGMFIADIIIRTSDKKVKLIIECDGYEFHKKTKEQVIRDNRRDRACQIEGYKVFRYSGSEIYEDPLACVDDIVRILKGGK